MGFLVLFPFAALAGWCVWRIYRWLHRGSFSPEWRRRFFLFALAGVALGTWFAFFAAYNIAGKRIEGFPFPLAIWNRENPASPLLRHPVPPAIRAGSAVTDLFFGTLLCLVPLALAAFVKENKGQKDFTGPRGGLAG